MNTQKKLLIAAVLALPLASCKNTDVWDPDTSKTDPTEVNTFDYKTTSSVKTSITYTSFPNDIKGSVYFEVYDVYPFESEDAFANLKSDIEPVFTGYTNEDGTFSESMTLPAYMTKAYVYSPNPLVTSLMTADVANGAFTATDAATTKAVSRAWSSTRATGDGYSEAVTKDGWKTLLIGDNYDKTTGKLTDSFLSSNLQNSSLKLTTDEFSTILTTFNSYRQNVSSSTNVGNIPNDYGSEKDMLITGGSSDAKYAEIAITLVQSATWWTSTVGYYYYKDGNAPSSYDELKNRAIVIVPNALSRNTDTNSGQTQDQCGMSPNTTVQLKYYGDYNATTKKYEYEEQGKEGSYNFPVGTRIGFVLYSNAWSNKAHSTAMSTRAATSQDCCVYGSSSDTGKPLTAVFGINNFVVISFEDDNLSNAGRYTDCIFTTKSNPIDALDVANVESTTNENTETLGVYAFEDLWPSVGDYDMNDVVIDASRKQTSTITNKTDNNQHETTTYGYSSETFNFTTYKNYATLDNHWAVRLEGIASSLTQDQIMVTKDGNAAQAAITKEGNDYLVQMESVDVSTDHKYAISLVWSKTFTSQWAFKNAYANKTSIEVFANRPDESWEVHIPYEAPTTSMKTSSLFGTQDDKTNIAQGNWYTRSGEYPFAFFLSGATHNDISPLLDRSNESKPINQLYPYFFNWVESNGKSHSDWYKAE